jgi:hypothetical protein
MQTEAVCLSIEKLSLPPVSVDIFLGLLFDVKMEAICSSEMSDVLRTIWRYNPEDCTFYSELLTTVLKHSTKIVSGGCASLCDRWTCRKGLKIQ